MAGTTEIMQEYLTKLGFVVDAVSFKKLTDALTLTEKKVMTVGAGVAGMVVAVEAGVAAFAFQMEKMYYASKLTNTTVKGLLAVERAGEQIGIRGESMESAIHGMAQAMRLNPGLQALVESFGIKVEGRDVSDVMLDYVRALKSMPEYVGAQYAGLFGIDPDTYHLMITQLDTLTAKQKQNLELFAQYGVDPDQAAETLKNYANQLRNTENRLQIMGMVFAKEFSPQFQALNSMVADAIDWWIGWAHGINSVESALKDVEELLATSAVQRFLNLIGHLVHIPNLGDVVMGSPEKRTTPGSSLIPPRLAGRPGTPAEETIAALQAQGWTHAQAAGITANLVRESQLNPNAVGDKGTAYGLAQWHPDRQADFARMFGHLIQQSTKDEQLQFLTYEMRKGKWQAAGQKLAGATNAGEAADIVSRYYERPAATEKEAQFRSMLATRLGTERSATQVAMNQNTNIHVHGDNAKDTAKMVAMEQSRINGDLVRNMGGWVAG